MPLKPARLLLLLTLLAPACLHAQQPVPTGDFTGGLDTGSGTLHLTLHLSPGACTLDSTDQGALGIACTAKADGTKLAVDVPAVQGGYTATISANGLTLTGTWSQGGNSLPLTMRKITESLPPPPPAGSNTLAGIWLGTLTTPGGKLRVQLHFSKSEDPSAGTTWTCTADSPDQGVMGFACKLTSATNPVAFEVPAVHASFTGTLTGDTLTGTFTQGAPLPLTFTRQAVALQAAVAPPQPPDPALPPVSVDKLKAVLDRDLAAAIKSGALADGNAGITIGVVQHGVRRIFTYGIAKPDSVFEIGSITKTFTATILAQMVEQHTVRLDEPVRDLLPPNTVAKPANAEITLLDLSDQHSGLPRMPDNFHPADPANPYADYDPKLLYAFIAAHGLALPANAPFGYSNLGVGLLGQALANRAAKPYPELLREQVLVPLSMADTTIALTSALRPRLIQGYDDRFHPAHAWDLDALNGAGGIRSTAADMLTYLEAQLHPDKLSPTTPAGKTLPAAIALTHVLHAEVDPGEHIALNWFHIDSTGSFWHNGGTGGYSSFALFNPALDFAIIVLSNSGPGPHSITDKLGGHIAERLTGHAAVSLAPTS